MLAIAEALERCSEALTPLPGVAMTPLDQAVGRVLAEPALAALDLPPFPQSGLDGYAVAASDTASATATNPVRLKVVGEVSAGAPALGQRLERGQALRIYTGAMLPEGASAVLAQEEAVAEADGLTVAGPVSSGRAVRARGEELAAGTELLPAGIRLTPGRLGALAAAGVARVVVARSPRIRLLITGDEVRPVGAALSPGAVYDANGPLVTGWLSAFGYRDVAVRHVTDDREDLTRALEEALGEADLVVTTGGVSVGERDLVVPVAEALGVQPVFRRVRQKPGRPLYLGRSSGGVPLLGLPGNPGAVACALAVFLRRLLDLLEGVADPRPELRRGRLAVPCRSDAERDCWIRARWRTSYTGALELVPLLSQASHMLSNLTEADALVLLPASGEPYPEGSVVEWLPLYEM